LNVFAQVSENGPSLSVLVDSTKDLMMRAISQIQDDIYQTAEQKKIGLVRRLLDFSIHFFEQATVILTDGNFNAKDEHALGIGGVVRTLRAFIKKRFDVSSMSGGQVTRAMNAGLEVQTTVDAGQDRLNQDQTETLVIAIRAMLDWFLKIDAQDPIQKLQLKQVEMMYAAFHANDAPGRRDPLNGFDPRGLTAYVAAHLAVFEAALELGGKTAPLPERSRSYEASQMVRILRGTTLFDDVINDLREEGERELRAESVLKRMSERRRAMLA
jgi:hypothetical protein